MLLLIGKLSEEVLATSEDMTLRRENVKKNVETFCALDVNATTQQRNNATTQQ
jgi:hypothetical protein